MLTVALVAAGLAWASALPLSGPGAVMVADAAMRGDVRRATWIGVGAAVPELAWATLAFGGAAAALAGRPDLAGAAHLVAAAVLAGVAVALWRSPAGGPPSAPRPGRAFWVGFAATALNPTLLLTWATVAGALVAGGYARGGPAEAVAFGLGVGVGSAASALTVAWLFTRLRRRFGPGASRLVTRGGAVLLAALAAVAVLRALGA